MPVYCSQQVKLTKSRASSIQVDCRLISRSRRSRRPLSPYCLRREWANDTTECRDNQKCSTRRHDDVGLFSITLHLARDRPSRLYASASRYQSSQTRPALPNRSQYGTRFRVPGEEPRRLSTASITLSPTMGHGPLSMPSHELRRNLWASRMGHQPAWAQNRLYIATGEDRPLATTRLVAAPRPDAQNAAIMSPCA
jgi:hypothetical protein